MKCAVFLISVILQIVLHKLYRQNYGVNDKMNRRIISIDL